MSADPDTPTSGRWQPSPPAPAPAPTPTTPGLWPVLLGALVVSLTVGTLGHGLFGGWPLTALFAGGLAGYAYSRIRYLRGRLQAQQEHLLLLEATLTTLVDKLSPEPPRASAPAPEPPPEPAPPARPPTTVLEPEAEPAVVFRASAKPATARPPTSPAPAPAATRSGGPDFFSALFDWFRQGNPIAKLGIAILLLGASFLAKYSMEQGLLPPSVRMAALAAGALGLLLTGWRLRRRRPGYSLILQGGGVGGFYLTVFAASKLYQLLPTGLALGLMVAVSLAAAVLALAQEGLSLAVIGLSGGFMAPILLSTGSGNHVALFTYYAVLNLGVLVLALRRAWPLVPALGFVFTFGVYTVWRAQAYQPEQLHSALGFLLLFFALYLVMAVREATRSGGQGLISGGLSFGLPLAAFGLTASLLKQQPMALAFAALGYGTVYLVLARALARRSEVGARTLGEAAAALGIIFGSLAVPLACGGYLTSAIWAIEGAGLLWLGLRQSRPWLRVFGLLLQVLASIACLKEELRWLLQDQSSFFFGGGLLAAAALFCGWQLHAHLQARGGERALAIPLSLLASLWWLEFLGHAIDALERPDQQAGLWLAAFALSLILLLGLATRLRWPWLARLASLFMLVGTAVGFGHAIDHHPSALGGGWGWPLWAATVIASLWRLDRRASEAGALVDRPALPLLHAHALYALSLLLPMEISAQLPAGLSWLWHCLAWGLLPALLLVLLLGRAARRWPLAAQPAVWTGWGLAPLALLAALWCLAMALGPYSDPAPLPYWPLLNPLDLGLAFVLLSLLQAWRRLAPEQRQRWARWLPPTLAALAFIASTSALVRGLHYGAGAALGEGLFRDVTQLAALSLYWGLLALALMTVAARRGQRLLWIAGAGLMAVVVLKLFLLDLDGRGSLARVLSFIGVGGLLLLTGYLAPIPPANATKDESHD
ncbi:MAG: DUF2339 domain-containing protein [Stagnimonas sp.]|nr:DUF2339 domain-containing protein [Stagnimonas sp.]